MSAKNDVIFQLRQTLPQFSINVVSLQKNMDVFESRILCVLAVANRCLASSKNISDPKTDVEVLL